MRSGILLFGSVVLFCVSIVFASESVSQVSSVDGTDDAVARITAILKAGGDINATDEAGRGALHVAVEAKSLKLVDLLIKADVDENQADKKGMTPLHVAAEKGYTEIAGRLLEGGAEIDARREDGRAPLYLALRYGHEETATMLLDAQADARAADLKGWMPIHAAGIYCSKSMLVKLIEKGASINDVALGGWNALHCVAMTGSKESAANLIESGIDINAFSDDNRTALHIAVEYKKKEIVRLLVSSGASATIFRGKGDTVFCIAVRDADKELVMLLVENGADVNALGKSGTTALRVAAGWDNYEMMELLVSLGADVNIESFGSVSLIGWAKVAKDQKKIAWFRKHGAAEWLWGDEAIARESDPFLRACIGGDKELIREFIEDGTGDLSLRDQAGATGLHWIVYCSKRHRSIELVELAIEHGADVNASDKFGVTPLYWAANRGMADAAEVLLKHGAKVDAKTKAGMNPLLVATSGINLTPATAKVLLSNGADITVRDPKGNTPLHKACDAKHSQIVKLLLSQGAPCDVVNNSGILPIFLGLFNPKVAGAFVEHGYDINTATSIGKTVLHSACWGNYLGTVEYLLGQGANVNALAKDGTPLHYAAYKGRDDIVKLLLRHGADSSIKNSYGKTALDMATEQKKLEVVKMLSGEADDSLAVELKAAEEKKAQERRAEIRMGALYRWSTAESKIHYAAASGDIKKLKQLVEAGEDPNAFYEFPRMNFSALHCAVYFDEVKTIDYLLDIGVDVDVINRNKKQTPLHIAAREGNIKAATKLLERGAGIDSVEQYEGQTPLHYACEAGHIGMVKFLMEKGADIRKASAHGEYPFHSSVIHKEPEIAAIFLEAGIGINESQTNSNICALHQACYNAGPVEFLLKRGADATIDSHRGTPMHFASVLYDKPETFRLLLEYGADIHAGENGRGTPLHPAAKHGRYESVKFLLEQGADTSKLDSSLRTALHVVSSDVRVVKLLLEYGADPLLVDANGKTALYYIASQSRVRDADVIIPIYTKAGVDINRLNNSGMNPVHQAIINGRVEMLRVLIDCGADLTIPYRGKTPLQLSLERKKIAIQKMLEAQGVKE